MNADDRALRQAEYLAEYRENRRLEGREMDNEQRDRIYQYAKFYKVTSYKRDFLAAVKRHFQDDHQEEAEIAWEAIDQYLGMSASD